MAQYESSVQVGEFSKKSWEEKMESHQAQALQRLQEEQEKEEKKKTTVSCES